MQQLLQVAGVKVPGGADGVYGASTAAAVLRFQSARGLAATGNVDPATAVALGLVSPTPWYVIGSHGDGVRAIQQQLLSAGIPIAGGADGLYGEATANAVRSFQTAHRLRATGQVDALTASLIRSSQKASPVAPHIQALDSFPVPATCAFWDTWGAPRAGGRIHEGVDIFAKKGSPVLAVRSGRITSRTAEFPGSFGGNQEWLTAADGTRYFYAHLSSFAKGVGPGSPVHAGDVVGYTGATGLATVPHLHFEIHPGGGAPVNPYATLRAMITC
jgi:murein DD-endopeptidase MepM/ murein hydrolase activator NlpD